MNFKNEDAFKLGVKNNKDPCGARVYTYAKDWAELMEKAMAGGASLESCAEQTSREDDTDGITGFMYGAACSVLSRTWVHGEALRIWHNAQYGVQADAKGCVNPAILTISPKANEPAP